MYRHHPSWLTVLDLVRSGRIGRLMAVDSWFSFWLDDPANIRSVAAYGGGALYDIGCYCVNLSRLLFGGEPLAVSAMIERDPALGVDVTTSGTMAFEGGLASFTCSTRVEADQRVHIYGTEGRISDRHPVQHPARAAHARPPHDRPQAPGGLGDRGPGDRPRRPVRVRGRRLRRGDPRRRPAPVPLADAIANMRVIERLRAGRGGRR